MNDLSEPAGWPQPPHFRMELERAGQEVETCQAILNDGTRIAGKLAAFDMFGSRLAILPAGDTGIRTIAFDELRLVSLGRRIRLRPLALELEARAGEVSPPSEVQTFAVDFVGGESVHGETMGHVHTAAGLFLYEPTGDGTVSRRFYPRSALRHLRIGLALGEILVDEDVVSRDAVDAALRHQRELRSRKIGDYLTQVRIVTREKLGEAIAHQSGKPLLRLGETLIELGHISQEQLDDALVRQRTDRTTPLGRILTQMGAVDERTVRDTLARKLGIPFVTLAGFNFEAEAAACVPAALARKRLVVPLCFHEGALVVACEDPLDGVALDEVRFISQRRVIPVMASRDDLARSLAERYGRYGSGHRAAIEMPAETRNEYEFHKSANVDIDQLASSLRTEDTTLALAQEGESEPETVLVQLVNKMILDAWTDGVSDIHVETYPGKQNTKIRFRKDGTLVDYLEVPGSSSRALVSRIKIMSNLVISERRKPQDGRLVFRQFGPADIELRVATIPTANGLEDVVMRVLSASKPVPIDELGVSPASLGALKRLMERPYGLILVCGPTGSGKTTTLHSLLGHINVPGRKIWTAEDPIEITQAGLRQVQVHPKIGWTFATAMRSFLRADPDVIMVGEMRDAETARAAIEASLTGHLVLSTLHTNSAAESVVRLLDLGMDPFNFADSLLAILAQRLAKALCPECREPYRPDAQELEELATEYGEGLSLPAADTLARWRLAATSGEGLRLHRAKGCALCNQSGYRGRIGLHELLVMTPPLRHLVQTRGPVQELVRVAVQGGMRLLKQDGIEKVLAGRTDIGKVRAVCS